MYEVEVNERTLAVIIQHCQTYGLTWMFKDDRTILTPEPYKVMRIVCHHWEREDESY